ncbi:hypothetical protein DWV00_25320 [Trinickia dinghuensis]|uniref:Uncharacterized protein n=1 Tax=Trinickia dinghuensis TaxID=2291023 RepID=A0A3D8JUB6_9BURK|nr:hypothetical protein DWV00_25320 [Trinickia dinghuensis]
MLRPRAAGIAGSRPHSFRARTAGAETGMSRLGPMDDPRLHHATRVTSVAERTKRDETGRDGTDCGTDCTGGFVPRYRHWPTYPAGTVTFAFIADAFVETT